MRERWSLIWAGIPIESPFPMIAFYLWEMVRLLFAGVTTPMAIKWSGWRWMPRSLFAGFCFISCLLVLEKSATMAFLQPGAKKIVCLYADAWRILRSHPRNCRLWHCCNGYWGKISTCALAASWGISPENRHALPNVDIRLKFMPCGEGETMRFLPNCLCFLRLFKYENCSVFN